MITGLDVKETVKYVSKTDPDTQNPTTFVLRGLTNREKLTVFGLDQIGKMVDDDGLFSMKSLKINFFDIVLYGLVRVLNLDGQNYEVVSADILNRLPFALIVEIGGEILKLSNLEGISQKNLP